MRALAILLVGCGHGDAPSPEAIANELFPRRSAPEIHLKTRPDVGEPPSNMVAAHRGPKAPDLYIDRTEVTMGAYRECVEAGMCVALECGDGPADVPVACIEPEQASLYCSFRGKRLPTIEEWRLAAFGTSSHRYPWGDQPPTCDLVVMKNGKKHCDNAGLARVGSHPANASPTGALDMIGNVAEIVSESFNEDPPYVRWTSVGGSWQDQLTDAYELAHTGGYTKVNETIGFRCARDAANK